MPWDLVAAIDHAHTVLNWHENYAKKEVPPKWMWHLDHELDIHFERIEEERGSGGSSSSGSSSSGDTTVPMMRNALTADLRR